MLLLEQAIVFALGGHTDVVEKLEEKGQEELLKAGEAFLLLGVTSKPFLCRHFFREK